MMLAELIGPKGAPGSMCCAGRFTLLPARAGPMRRIFPSWMKGRGQFAARRWVLDRLRPTGLGGGNRSDRGSASFESLDIQVGSW